MPRSSPRTVLQQRLTHRATTTHGTTGNPNHLLGDVIFTEPLARNDIESRKGVQGGERVDQGSHTFAFTAELHIPPTITVSSRHGQTHLQLWFPFKYPPTASSFDLTTMTLPWTTPRDQKDPEAQSFQTEGQHRIYAHLFDLISPGISQLRKK